MHTKQGPKYADGPILLDQMPNVQQQKMYQAPLLNLNLQSYISAI